MLDWFLELLKNPEFQIFVATYAGTKLLDSAGSKIKQLKDHSKKGTPEWQFLTCLERAFFATETQLGWEHKTEAIYESFEDALLSHQGFFTITNLKEIFEAAVGHPVSEADLEAWVGNFKRELAMGDYPALLRFLSIDHMLQTKSSAPIIQINFILTSSASIYDNPEIICRDAFIDDLLQLLSSGHKRIQIIGMGGLGKTETLTKLYAKLAADKLHSCFEHIAFIRFSGDIVSDIESQLDYPREYLGLKGIEAAKRFLHDICAEKNVLLCIDDIRANQEIVKQDDPSIQFFRSLGTSVVLAARAGFPDFERNDLGFLSTKACIELFEKKYGMTVTNITDVEILTSIIENRAGNHTLIINRLGNMAKDYGWSIPILAERLKDKTFDFQKGIADEELLQQEINKLYQVNDELSLDEKSILEAFSIFPAIPLDADMCVEWLYEDAGIDEDLCILQLNKMAEKTWLEKGCGIDNTFTFAMHQLVKASVQRQLKMERTSHLNLVSRCATSLYNSVSAYKLSKSFAVLQFAKSIFSATIHASIPHGQLSGEIGYFYSEVAEYCASLEWYQKTLDICAGIESDDPPNVANVYNNIAVIHKCQGNYGLALEWYQKALSVTNPEEDDDLIFIALVHSNIGIVYNMQQEHDLALEQYNISLEYSHKAHDIDSIAVAKTYTNIASVFDDLGKYRLALEWNFKALAIKEKKLDKDHPSIATSYNNIALVLKFLGMYDLSYEWNQKSLKIRECIYGEDHPETAMSYLNIAYLHLEQGRTAEAIYLFKKVLQVYENRLGSDHQDTIKVKNELLHLEN